MFSKLLAIIRRDFFERFSSRSELLFFLILPIVFTTILSGSFGPADSDDNRIPVAVVNEDDSPAAATLLETLSASTTVIPQPYGREEALALVDDGDIAGALVIPAGFGGTLETAEASGRISSLLLRLDNTNTNSLIIEQAIANSIDEVTSPYAMARTVALAVADVQLDSSQRSGGERFPQLVAAAGDALEARPSYVRTEVEAARETDSFDGASQASAGQIITWVLIPLLGISALLTFERLSGTLRRLLVTPTRKSTYLFGTLTAQLLLGLLQIALLVGFGALVLGVDFGSSPLGLMLLLVSFALAGVALGTMLGTFTRTDSQANNLSIMLGMGMALLGGCWWPIELFPETVQTAVKVLPTTWAMQGMTDLMMRGQGVEGVLLESAVLVGFAVLFFAVGVRRFRFE